MSRLTELIQEYCPDGVEYKPFGEMATIVRGASPRPIKNFVTTEPEGVNWIKIGDVKPGSKYITKTAEKITLDGAKKSRFVKEGDFILSNSMSFGRPYIMKTQGCIHDGWLAISNFDNSFVPDFLYHLLNSNMYQQIMKQKASFGGAVQNLNADIVKELDMPVVPLEVQCEIVRILDNFTELTKELKAELTAELTARKKQYEYYRDNLLTFDSTIKQVRLGEICSVITKGTTPKSYTKTGISFVKTEAFDGTRIVPERLSYVDEETHTNFLRRSILEENDILVTIAGATIGKCAMVPKEILPANTNQALAIIRLAKGNSPKYVMYLLHSDLMKQYMQKKIKGSAQPNLNLKQLNDFIIPLPPLSVQERLVHVLDNFEAICSDLKIGLSAEIEARQKQYEFYRDALLTYAATGKTILTDRQTDRQTDRRA